MAVSTSSELEVVNGTNVRLKCTFKSTHPLSEERTSVSWSFQPLGTTTAEMVRLSFVESYVMHQAFMSHKV